MTTAPPAEDRIAAFLSRFSGGHPIGPEDDIFALGVMNSLLAMQGDAFFAPTHLPNAYRRGGRCSQRRPADP